MVDYIFPIDKQKKKNNSIRFCFLFMNEKLVKGGNKQHGTESNK